MDLNHRPALGTFKKLQPTLDLGGACERGHARQYRTLPLLLTGGGRGGRAGGGWLATLRVGSSQTPPHHHHGPAGPQARALKGGCEEGYKPKCELDYDHVYNNAAHGAGDDVDHWAPGGKFHHDSNP